MGKLLAAMQLMVESTHDLWWVGCGRVGPGKVEQPKMAIEACGRPAELSSPRPRCARTVTGRTARAMLLNFNVAEADERAPSLHIAT